MDKNKNIDRTNLTQDQVAQLDQYDASQKQLHALEDVSATVEQLVITLEQGQTKEEGNTEKLGALLTDMRTQLTSLASKETPQTPDYAKPVVSAVSKLETALTASLKAINVQPQVNLPETQVNVASPDLSGVEKILKNEVPKAFQSAIKAIPKTEIPPADYAPILESLSGLSEQLLSIENATRMKPLPGNMGILVNGKSVSTANPLPTDATFSGTLTTEPTFKDDPTATGEVPKYGKTNSSTHKQMVEADVTGSVTANAGTNLNTSALALESGNLTTIAGKDFATQTTLALIKAKTDNIDVALSTRTKPADAQHVIVDSGVTTGLTDTQLRASAVPVSTASLPLPSGAATAANQLIGLMPKVFDALTYTVTSPTVDTYSYFTGGTGGILVATLTVTFTAADHLVLVSAVRT